MEKITFQISGGYSWQYQPCRKEWTKFSTKITPKTQVRQLLDIKLKSKMAIKPKKERRIIYSRFISANGE